MSTASIEVYDSEGKVIISTIKGNYAFTPEQAVRFGEAMIKCAQACGALVVVESKPTPPSDKKVLQMQARAAHIIRTLQKQRRDAVYIAQHVVDSILAEVL